MYVGIIQAEMRIPSACSLKDKRRVIRALKDRLRNRFQVATAEVGVLDNCREATLGVTLVSNDVALAQSRCQAVIDFLDGCQVASLEDVQLEIL